MFEHSSRRAGMPCASVVASDTTPQNQQRHALQHRATGIKILLVHQVMLASLRDSRGHRQGNYVFSDQVRFFPTEAMFVLTRINIGARRIYFALSTIGSRCGGSVRAMAISASASKRSSCRL